MKPKTPIYITCQVLFIVLLTLVAAIFNPGYFAAGKGSMRHATKVILNDYTFDYKSHLIKLQLLPLMYMYNLSDILFFIISKDSQ